MDLLVEDHLGEMQDDVKAFGVLLQTMLEPESLLSATRPSKLQRSTNYPSEVIRFVAQCGTSSSCEEMLNVSSKKNRKEPLLIQL